jgi:hypothetical protein
MSPGSNDPLAGEDASEDASSAPNPELVSMVVKRLREAREPDGPRVPAPESDLPAQRHDLPTSLGPSGRFTVLEELGEGAYGVVYLAYDTELDRKVAVKVPTPRLLSSPGTPRQQFLAEARAAAALRHQNIVRVFQFIEDMGESSCHIVYEFCEAGSLARWLKERRGPAPPKLAACVVVQLAEAVQYAHEKGVLHCDLKPGNVLLQPLPREDTGAFPYLPQVSDFGLAQLMDRTGPKVTGGTPSYMSPEQARGDGDVGFASDVYSLGATLYELLTFRPPFVGATREDVLDQVRNDDPIPPRTLCPNIPRDLDAICLMCLKKRPEDRYAGAGELAADLHAYLTIRPVKARPASRLEHVGYAARRHSRVASLVGVCAALLSTGGAWHSWSLAEEQVQQFRLTGWADVPDAVPVVVSHLPWSRPGLDRMFASLDPDDKLRAALVLATTRPECRRHVFERLPGADPEVLYAICEVIARQPGMFDSRSPDRRLGALLDAREPEGKTIGPGKEALARQRANAAFALIRFGQLEAGWRLLEHRPDPTARSYLIHLLGPSGLPPSVIVERLANETSSSIRNALIQSLGEFPPKAWTVDERRRAIAQLLDLYRDSPDPGIHGSAKWVLRRWQRDPALRGDAAVQGLGARLGAIDAHAKAPPSQTPGTWRAGPLGITLVTLKLTDDSGRTRWVEVGDTEVTVRQFLLFRPEHGYDPAISPADDCPISAITGLDAMAFCNFLSGEDRIDPDQFAYRQADANTLEPFEQTLDRRGYRILTDVEAEAACRARASTSRHYGDPASLLWYYAWYRGNGEDHTWPVAALKPNEFGLFDTLGNIQEWCVQVRPAELRQNQAIRGGSFLYFDREIECHQNFMHSMASKTPYNGFRVARTIGVTQEEVHP